MSQISKSFADYKPDGHNWITLATGEYYPDVLKDACELYKPVLIMFGQLLKTSESSERLLLQIADIPDGWMRIQLARVFRKYVSPQTPVEMLKKKSLAQEICEHFGAGFRPIPEVQAAYLTRPLPDEALCAILWEYKDRGKKGYDLTDRFFFLFRSKFPDITIIGPERAGKDVLLGGILPDYPNPRRPVDFVLYENQEVLAIGLARYDSDRGGAQEDDRTGGYFNCANEILSYTESRGLKTKIIFLNDGPGLLLGSMWDDYNRLEQSRPGKILVMTLRMVTERITLDWLRS
ncbi:MAG TPA: hypothetical protein VHO69_00260 [Phototrophicaceae bacterium]|nr:hypothetical protein [Phototrophicaceae bacterium]